MRILTSALIRGLVAGALPIAALWIADRSLAPDQGADIGGGLVLLVALIAIPFLWARRDGALRGSRAAVGLWCLAAVIPWLADALRTYVDNGGRTVTDAVGSLGSSLFLVLFFLAGGLVGAVVGASRHTAPVRRSGGQG